MNPFKQSAAIFIAAFSFFSFDVSAAIDNDASVVLLRTSCEEVPGVTLNNCFTSPDSLMNWAWNTRTQQPSASAPLLVEIGPGDFSPLYVICPSGKGFITFRGAGREKTAFKVFAPETNFDNPLSVTGGCQSLNFEALTVKGFQWGVTWDDGGSSTWMDVEIVGATSAWYDSANGIGGTPCAAGQQGTHKFFGSTVRRVTDGQLDLGNDSTFFTSCGKHWFWGSEIAFDGTTTTAGFATSKAVVASGSGNEIHVYGSNIRLFSGSGSALTGMVAAQAQNSGQIHIHGTGIDMIATKPVSLDALIAVSGGEIHADVSAYVFKTVPDGNVRVRRVVTGSPPTGHIHAPYQWQHVPDPATIPNYTSLDGADQTTIVTPDGYPHLVTYSSKCKTDTGGLMRWYDTTDKVCR